MTNFTCSWVKLACVWSPDNGDYFSYPVFTFIAATMVVEIQTLVS